MSNNREFKKALKKAEVRKNLKKVQAVEDVMQEIARRELKAQGKEITKENLELQMVLTKEQYKKDSDVIERLKKNKVPTDIEELESFVTQRFLYCGHLLQDPVLIAKVQMTKEFVNEAMAKVGVNVLVSKAISPNLPPHLVAVAVPSCFSELSEETLNGIVDIQAKKIIEKRGKHPVMQG